jgi:hypothetical protein
MQRQEDGGRKKGREEKRRERKKERERERQNFLKPPIRWVIWKSFLN